MEDKLIIENDRIGVYPIYGGRKINITYYVTYKLNTYYVTTRVRGIKNMRIELEVEDIQMPEDTNIHTLTKEAIIEKIEEYLYKY